MALALAGVPAAAEPFLSAAEAMAVIADGQPWTAMPEQGRPARITLNPDGTGNLQAAIMLPLHWRPQGDALCVSPPLAGPRCLRFRRTGGGFEAWQGGALDMRLLR